MSYRTGFLTGLGAGVILCSALVASYWTATSKSSATSKPAAQPAPATVTKTLKEEEINVITLKKEAIDRLGLRTGTIEKKSVPRARVYNGEITVPPGQSVTVSAPLSGIVNALSDDTPKAGQTVKAGQPLFRLMPLLTPDARANLSTSAVDASEQVKSAQTQVDAARIAYERAKRLFQNEAGSRRAVDETQAQLEIAERALDAARARVKQLNEVLGELKEGTASPLVIKSPDTGILRNISALTGQNVPLGAPLFEVVNLERLWVRVPVYAGDVEEIDGRTRASIGNLAGRAESNLPVEPVNAPPSANPAAGTVDFYYQFENTETQYRPGHRVAVQVPLHSEESSLVAPWSAVVYDIHGGTWVYEQTAERTYSRRRVSVRYVRDGSAVLASGPVPGTVVVEAGAAELFGTETGFTK
jgi:RND family efflux transporter MFP subunit